MKMCPNCHNQINDQAVFCPVCGNAIGVETQFQPVQTTETIPEHHIENHTPPVCISPTLYADPYDHTNEFTLRDITENKVAAMMIYLLGPVGILIALMAAGSSKYVTFHAKEGMKLTVTDILGILLLAIAAFVLWNIRLRVFMLFVICVALVGLAALHLLCFFYVCKGKAIETPIIRSLKFLK